MRVLMLLLATLAAVHLAPARSAVRLPEPEPVRLTVRVTFYTLRGVMFNGEHVHEGAAACSWNLPLGTLVEFDDGRQVVCTDRGHLGNAGWIDVWMPDYATGLTEVEGRYGMWATVTAYME
jgi:3D (Asp-Asp-Asp) domain-containing protein